MSYPPAASDEAIKGLADQKILEYDPESGMCELVGVLKTCPYCKSRISIDATSCPKCGAQLKS